MGRKSTLNRGTSGVRKKPSNSKHQNAYRVLIEKKNLNSLENSQIKILPDFDFEIYFQKLICKP